MSLLVLSGADVDSVAASMTPDSLQLLMAQVFARLSSSSKARPGVNTIHMPPRIILPTENHTALFMPARIGSAAAVTSDAADGTSEGTDTSILGTAVKVVCVPNGSDPRGIPGTTLVLDEVTGAVKAVVNARKLTALRNAAGSLLSTTLVGPTKPRNIVAFGAGQQIEAHIDMHFRYFATLARCTIVNRTINARATALIQSLRAKHGNLGAEFNLLSTTNGIAESTGGNAVEDAVRAADIIVCATSSSAPLFPSSWVRNGTHVILIGSYKPTMHEIDTALVQRALPVSALSSHQTLGQLPILLVDSREDCLKEAGELITAGIRSDHVTEIGELLPTTEEGSLSLARYHEVVSSGAERNRRNNGDLTGGFDGPVTMFKSVGIGLQDVAIASAVVNKALSLGKDVVGTVVADYDA